MSPAGKLSNVPSNEFSHGVSGDLHGHFSELSRGSMVNIPCSDAIHTEYEISVGKALNGGHKLKSTRPNCLRIVPEVVEHASPGTRGLVVLPFSGHDKHSLKANILAIGAVADQFELSDIAYTLSARRSRFFQRAFVIANSTLPSKVFSPDTAVYGTSPAAKVQRVGFLFTGKSICS